MRITIDTETDSFADALSAVYAAYGRSAAEVPGAGAEGDPDEVVWSSRYGDTLYPWTRAMIREWVRRLDSVDALDLAWRVCSAQGRPVSNAELIAHLAPDAPSAQAGRITLSRATREASRIGRDIGVGMPLINDEKRHTRAADPVVAAIVLRELAAHPRSRELAHVRRASPAGTSQNSDAEPDGVLVDRSTV